MDAQGAGAKDFIKPKQGKGYKQVGTHLIGDTRRPSAVPRIHRCMALPAFFRLL
jgi:hypothetical protein